MPRPPPRGERGPTRPSPQLGPRGGGAAFSSSPLPPCPQPPLPGLSFPGLSQLHFCLGLFLLFPGPFPLACPAGACPSPYSRPFLEALPGASLRAEGAWPPPLLSPPAPLISFLLFPPSLWSSVDSLHQPVPTSHSPLALVYPFSSSLAPGKPPLLSEKSRVIGATPLGIGSSGRREWPGSPSTQAVFRRAGSFPPCGSSWLIVCL